MLLALIMSYQQVFPEAYQDHLPVFLWHSCGFSQSLWMEKG